MDPQSRIAEGYARLRSTPHDGSAWSELARGYFELKLGWHARHASAHAIRFGVRPRFDGELLAKDFANGLPRTDWPSDPPCAQELREAVARYPGDWLSWLYLARLHELDGRTDAANFALDRAQALEPLAGESLHWLAVRRLYSGDAVSAIVVLMQLMRQRPVRHDVMLSLAEALLVTGDTVGASRAFVSAARSTDPELLRQLRSSLYRHGRGAESVAVGRRIVQLLPESVHDWLALAELQIAGGELQLVKDSLAHVYSLQPRNPRADMLAAHVLQERGDAPGAMAMLTMLCDQEHPPEQAEVQRAITAMHSDSLSAAEKAALHRGLILPVRPSQRASLEPEIPRSVRTQLRVGYITDALHDGHPLGEMLLPILLKHDESRVEAHVYYTGYRHDTTTLNARKASHGWREAHTWDAETLARQIRHDGIEILVDMGNPASVHRAAAFGARLAPVQAAFLGHPQTSGVPHMDWLIGDRTATPSDHEPLYAEGIAQLPVSVICWSPPHWVPLPAPRKAGRPVVFGASGEVLKFSHATVALWARVLTAVPESRLILRARAFADAVVRERYLRQFAEYGIEAQRVDLRELSGAAEPATLLQLYAEVDIVLDPLPVSATVDTLQALWMGVPVVTRCGDNYASRVGASILTALGRPDWVATDDSAYVRIAAALAARHADLVNCRPHLRQQLSASPLADAHRYTRALEYLYARMWEHRRHRSTSRLLAPREYASKRSQRVAQPA